MYLDRMGMFRSGYRVLNANGDIVCVTTDYLKATERLKATTGGSLQRIPAKGSQ